MSSRYDETTGKWVHTFRQSFLSSYSMCAEQARADYAGESKRDPEHTDSTALGTAVHAGIEYMLYEKQAGAEPYEDELHDYVLSPDGDRLLLEAISVAHNELDGFGEWAHTKMSRKLVYERAEIMLDRFLTHVMPDVEPAHMEWGFDLPFYEDEHRIINFSGTADCVDVDGRVLDWKTASRAYEPWEKQRWAVQPTVYLWARWLTDWLEKQDRPFDSPMPETTFRYAILLYDGTHQILDVTRDQHHVDWLLRQSLQIASMIELEVNPWPLNDSSWACSPRWCGKWDDCKGAAMGDLDWTKTVK